MVHNNIESKNNGVLVIPKRKDQKHEIGLATSFRGALAQIGVTLGGVRTGRGRPGCVHKIEFLNPLGDFKSPKWQLFCVNITDV